MVTPNHEIPRTLHDSLGPRDRRLAVRCLTLLGVLSAASFVGVAASLYLAHNHPLVLVALSPLFRHLILVAPAVDPASFVVVATLRSLAFFLACFYLGRAFGPPGLEWLESRAPRTGRFVRWIERVFERASWAAVLLLVGPAVAVIAGIAGMKAAVFTGLASLALVTRMALILELGDWLREPLEVVRHFVGENWLPGTVVLLFAIVLYQGWQRRRRAASRP
jgi:membrane protein DedA with SNARE-associated domain